MGLLDSHPPPQFRKTPLRLTGGLSPPSFTQQKIVWGPTCHHASTATPSSMEKTPSGTADVCWTSRHPGWVRRTDPPLVTAPAAPPRQDLQPGETSPLNEIAAATPSL